jgi:hypothetical protein
MAAANEAKKKAVEEIIDDISILTPQTAYTPSTLSTNTSISSTTLSFNSSNIERGRYMKSGSSLEEFMEGNLDWRSFGSITYNEMKEVGLFDRLKKKISFYNNARTNITRHKAVICSSELPLSEVASRLLDTKMRVVEHLMDGIEKDPGGGVRRSEDRYKDQQSRYCWKYCK